jgi:hypothetical protein
MEKNYLARGIVHFQVDFARRRFGNTWSSSISPWLVGKHHGLNEVLSEARLLRCEAHSVTSMPQSAREFCDVDCDVTLVGKGRIDRFGGNTR